MTCSLVVSSPLKNMSSSVGMMILPNRWKVIKFMFQTTNQSPLNLCENLCVESTSLRSSNLTTWVGKETPRNLCFVLQTSHTMWGPRSIVKLVQITPITMVYGTYNKLVTGANLNQLITWGAPHCKPPVHPQVHREKDLQHRDADRPVAAGLVAHDPEVQELSAGRWGINGPFRKMMVLPGKWWFYQGKWWFYQGTWWFYQGKWCFYKENDDFHQAKC